jgi:hypothetical protein
MGKCNEGNISEDEKKTIQKVRKKKRKQLISHEIPTKQRNRIILRTSRNGCLFPKVPSNYCIANTTKMYV